MDFRFILISSLHLMPHGTPRRMDALPIITWQGYATDQRQLWKAWVGYAYRVPYRIMAKIIPVQATIQILYEDKQEAGTPESTKHRL